MRNKRGLVGVIAVLLMVSLFGSGCATALYATHHRNVMRRDRIVASGNPEAIGLLSRGVSPREVIKIAPMQNGNGIKAGVNLLALGDPTIMDALSDEKGKTAAVIILDALMAWGGYEAYRAWEDSNDDDGNDGESRGSGTTVTISNGDGNTVNVVNGDGNTSNNDDNTQASGDSGSNDVYSGGEE